MDILNFISWIKGSKLVSTVDSQKTLIPLGVKTNRRDDDYAPVTMTVQDFISQIPTPPGPAGGDLSGNYPNPSVIWNNGLPTYDLQYYPLSLNPAGYIDSSALGPYLTTATAASTYQPTLVSGTNIKTVNSTSLVGSGDVAVQPTLVSGTNIKTVNGSSLLGSGDLTIGGGGGASGIHTQMLGGGAIFGGVETSNMVVGANLSSYLCQPSQMTYFPYIPNKTFTSTTLSFNVTSATAGAVCKLLIYSHNGINAPQDKLYESVEIDLSTTGGKTISTSFTFTAGTTYWFGIYSNVSGPSISALGTNGGALPVCFLGTILVLAWVQVSLTYPTAPLVASPNSFQNIAPLIRLK